MTLINAEARGQCLLEHWPRVFNKHRVSIKRMGFEARVLINAIRSFMVVSALCQSYRSHVYNFLASILISKQPLNTIASPTVYLEIGS